MTFLNLLMTTFLAEGPDISTIFLVVGLLVVFVLLIIFLKFFKLWVQSYFSNADISLFELVGMSGEDIRPDAEAIERFEWALEAYTARRLREAADGFREVRDLCGGKDGPSEFYLETLERLATETPSGDCDGVISFVTT